ncbi:synaptotagmin-like protein 4 [Stigmatopora nigra]
MPQPMNDIDLQFLSESERDLILEVLRRDEELRQTEEQRIRKLKSELQEIKRKGAKRGSRRYSQRSCARCQSAISLFAFTSNQCRLCRHLVCGQCRAALDDGSWLCAVCIKESDLKKSTGDWFYNVRVNRFSSAPGHELVRSSLRQKPPLTKYVTMGDVLLKHSQSSRGPPVPVPRQKASTAIQRPSSENSGSIHSGTSFETKGDLDGPLSEYSGSVASMTSYETQGNEGSFKPWRNDAESTEMASLLASGKTETESGRVTPDVPRRAMLPPNYNPASVTLLTDAISIHSSSSDSNSVPETKQASPNQEFDPDKLFKKSLKGIPITLDTANSEPDVRDQAVLPDAKGQFAPGLDLQVSEIKQDIPTPQFDVDNQFKKGFTHIENSPEDLVKRGPDVYDPSHTYESLMDAESPISESSSLVKQQAFPSPEFDGDNLFRKTVTNIEKRPEYVNQPDVYDQYHLYESLSDIENQFVQGVDTQESEIKQVITSPELEVDNRGLQTSANPEYGSFEWDFCDETHTYESLLDIENQFAQDLDTQAPDVDQERPNPVFEVEEIVQHTEPPPERIDYGLDLRDQSHTYETLTDVEKPFVHGLNREVPQKKRLSASPLFDVEEICDKSSKLVADLPEDVIHGLDSWEQAVYAVPVPAKRQIVTGSDLEVSKIEPEPEINIGQESMKDFDNPPVTECVEPDVCERADSVEIPVPAKRQFVQGLDPQVPEIKQVCPSPELDVKQLFKRSVTRTENAPNHGSALDLRENLDTLSVPMGNRSQSVPDLDFQEEEDEDIDSLVDYHKSVMASSTSSLRSTSMTSIYSDSGDGYSLDVKGEVIFTMFYDEVRQCLQVFIKECRKLAYGDTLRQLTNPYVKCYLLPDKSRQSKRKTTIKRHTCDPVYEETFKYPIPRQQLLTRSMLISVWHHGHLSSNPFLGEVEMALDCYDLDARLEECMSLMTKAPCCIPASAFSQFRGELVISLKYVTPKAPQKPKIKGFSIRAASKKVTQGEGGELHVLIKEAKNLIAMKSGGGTSDSFVKGYLFPSKSKTNKRKTPVVKKNLNPHYGHTFVYKELTLDQLKTMCLELTVWDKEPMLSNEFLGGVRLSSGEGSVKIGNDDVGMDSVGEEVSLWQKMMQYPDSWAEGSLPLRTTMRKKKDK